MIWWLGRRKTRVVDDVKMQMSRAWRERSSAPIRMHYSTLPKIVVVYKLFHLSNSFYLIFFLLLQFFFSEVFLSARSTIPRNTLFLYVFFLISRPFTPLLRLCSNFTLHHSSDCLSRLSAAVGANVCLSLYNIGCLSLFHSRDCIL